MTRPWKNLSPPNQTERNRAQKQPDSIEPQMAHLGGMEPSYILAQGASSMYPSLLRRLMTIRTFWLKAQWWPLSVGSDFPINLEVLQTPSLPDGLRFLRFAPRYDGVLCDIRFQFWWKIS